ncbi:unnamed protein product, partial [Meganyctiphanes norvegica]
LNGHVEDLLSTFPAPSHTPSAPSLLSPILYQPHSIPAPNQLLPPPSQYPPAYQAPPVSTTNLPAAPSCDIHTSSQQPASHTQPLVYYFQVPIYFIQPTVTPF